MASASSGPAPARRLSSGSGFGGESDGDTGSGSRGAPASHASVLEAWSKQIEASVGALRRRGSDNEQIEGLKVHYVETKPLSNGKAAAPPAPADEPAPGVSSREEMENLGKIYLRVKMEACRWLEQVLESPSLFVDESGARKDPCETETLLAALQNGVALCRVANALMPGCIPQFTSDFSKDTSFMVPLSERENIKRFIRACSDAMSIPGMLLFQVGDLHNNQSMPKVVLSLRAVAE